MSQWLRIADAARYVGVHPQTLRGWERLGRIAPERIGTKRERRYRPEDLDCVVGRGRLEPIKQARREALYVRVSGRGDQSSSLANQEQDLRQSCKGEIVTVYHDVGSGLSERRHGLAAMIKAARQGRLDVLRVTHRDRLARFGTVWIEEILADHDIKLEVLHDAETETELMTDFMSLVASFSGRLYGQRSAESRSRLLDSAQDHTP